MAHTVGAAQACPACLHHNGIMLNRSFGFFWRGLSLKRAAAMPRAPPGSSSSVRWVSAVPCPFARPSPPALSVFRRALCFGGIVRLFRPPCPTLIRAFVRGLSAGLSPPGSRRRSVRSCPPAPAHPFSVSACLVSRRYRYSFPIRAYPPYSCFRSVGFRRPRAAVEDFDQRTKQVRALLGIVIRGCCACILEIPIRRAYTSDQS